jgi:hypothetical protein
MSANSWTFWNGNPHKLRRYSGVRLQELIGPCPNTLPGEDNFAIKYNMTNSFMGIYWKRSGPHYESGTYPGGERKTFTGNHGIDSEVFGQCWQEATGQWQPEPEPEVIEFDDPAEVAEDILNSFTLEKNTSRNILVVITILIFALLIYTFFTI